ncbi:transcriptional regulator BolA [Candidatus Arsenophonus lipoptenae]|uniref:Transcriptional regulator BolA n=1 Tax=Candidatus Arsenophonus lipoptenae TaxID=634113 RepID=A0A120HPW5_9GAMM|nr:BolA family protein [Candidatus Arsenophonus lipoptenae]AMA65008.1 transcriptional regulator BolA [Candidatus Arsenophonus lipoptenae]
MDKNEIKQILIKQLKLNKVFVNGNGNNFQIIAIDDMFIGKSRIEKQQIIYRPLMEYIIDNRIHALSIKTYTSLEWIKDHKLNVL